ncbi:hypothetical protein [Thalassoroseus pseudoceratinae]|uniref:hypothetical protein n=1 Tax=Thalassoroseus pseudoceratinae TaxID=2713176 RepID=UPI001424A707|nr:hypothetical protein [Thalassoroseus pseudoceratinae]
MSARVRWGLTLVLLTLANPILADEPASTPKPTPAPNPEAVQQYSQAMQAYINSDPFAARQMAESAARNNGVINMSELDPEVVARMQQIGHSIPGLAPQLRPEDAEVLKAKKATRVAEKDALGKVIEQHPEILNHIVEMAVNEKNEQEAMRAILSLGTRAIPAHLKMLEHKDSKYRMAATANLAFAALDDSVEYPVATVLPALSRVAQEDADPKVQEAAQQGLAVLIGFLANDDYRRQVKQQAMAPLSFVAP